MPIKHTFQSAKSDGTDATIIQPSNWNDTHLMTDDTALANSAANSGYPTGAYSFNALAANGYPGDGRLTGARNGTLNAQRLQLWSYGTTYARNWIQASSAWSAWSIATQADSFATIADITAPVVGRSYLITSEASIYDCVAFDGTNYTFKQSTWNPLGTNSIADEAVTTPKLADMSVTETKLATAVQTKLNTVGTGGSATTADIVAAMIANGVIITPPAPTYVSKDDTARTYTFAPVPGHTAAQHEYKLRTAAYVDATSAALPVGTAALAAGDLLIRVKARTNVNPGAVHSNTQTMAAAGGGETAVTFNGLDNVTPTANSLVKTNIGNTGRANTVETISIGDSTESYFKFGLNSAAPDFYDVNTYLMPSAGAPYSNSSGYLAALEAISGTTMRLTAFNGRYQDFAVIPTDTLQLGDDGTGHITVWINGSIVYTEAVAITAQSAVLYILLDNQSNAQSGLSNVVKN